MAAAQVARVARDGKRCRFAQSPEPSTVPARVERLRPFRCVRAMFTSISPANPSRPARHAHPPAGSHVRRLTMLGSLAKKIFGSANDRRAQGLPAAGRGDQRAGARDRGPVGRAAARPHRHASRPSSPPARPSTTSWCRPSRRCARRPSASSASAISTCSSSAAWCCTRARIAEMRTGEGKTLVATLPVYLNALAGKGVHVVTVNDYLARRDAEWMGQVYRFLGLTVGIIVHGLDDARARRGLCLRHHLRHQQRVRLRLPARQHEVRDVARWSSAGTTSRSSTRSTRS